MMRELLGAGEPSADASGHLTLVFSLYTIIAKSNFMVASQPSTRTKNTFAPLGVFILLFSKIEDKKKGIRFSGGPPSEGFRLFDSPSLSGRPKTLKVFTASKSCFRFNK